MKALTKFGMVLMLAVGMSTMVSAQNAKSDVQSGRLAKDSKDAGNSGKKTAKKTGHKVKKGSKKAANKAAGKTEQGADRVKKKTQPK